MAQQIDPQVALTIAQVVQIIIGAGISIAAFWLSYRQWRRGQPKQEAETKKTESDAQSANAEAAESIAQAGKLTAETYQQLLETLTSKAESDLKEFKDLAKRLSKTESDFRDYRQLTDRRIADLSQQVETLNRQLIIKQDLIDRQASEIERLKCIESDQQVLIGQLTQENAQLREQLEAYQNGSE